MTYSSNTHAINAWKDSISQAEIDNNINQMKSELHARGVGQHFDEMNGWLKLLNILKDNEGNKKYFRPLAVYDYFKWNSSHFDENGAII